MLVSFTTILGSYYPLEAIATMQPQSTNVPDIFGLGNMTKFLHNLAAIFFFVPIATSGNNLYLAWPNNDTGHWHVFFAKSTDNGKTFEKTIIVSSANSGHTIDQNTQIAASGSNVYVTWWTNKTGTFEPVFRASNDYGNTFGNIVKLNSTTVGISK